MYLVQRLNDRDDGGYMDALKPIVVWWAVFMGMSGTTACVYVCDGDGI
jgi:hypothetical protein